MKLILLVLLFFYSIHSFPQKKERLQENLPAHDSIMNSKSAKCSNVFSSILLPTDSITPFPSDPLNPSMLSQVNKLDDVFVNSKSQFSAVSLGILQKEIKPLSINERRLYTAGDFKPIHLLALLGGSLDVDPIINAITGRTKRLKRYIQLEKKESILSFLEDHFTEYMVVDLNIEERFIGRFINYLVENEDIQGIIERKNFGELHFLIADEWFKFESLQNDPSPVNDAEHVEND